jgi:ParB/RepB/Spo0J family partition protein
MSQKLQIEYLPTDQLQMYDGNANIHSAGQIDQIAESIEEFDFSSPILAWHNEDGEAVIVAGHGRLMAARKLGIEELPVVFLDHMTDEQRRAFTIVENQLTRLSEFDMGILKVELENITNIDMTQFDIEINEPSFVDEEEVPDEFKEYGEDIETTNKCPRCGYEW